MPSVFVLQYCPVALEGVLKSSLNRSTGPSSHLIMPLSEPCGHRTGMPDMPARQVLIPGITMACVLG